jgi:hypothetical protein
MEADSNEEIAKMIGEYASKTDAKTIIAFGASPHSVKEGRLIRREEIDAVCQGKEVMVVKYDGHACIVSTPLLNKLNKKLSKPFYETCGLSVVLWVVGEGVAYITGAILYSFKKVPYIHSVFHVFVILEDICHIIATWKVIQTFIY